MVLVDTSRNKSSLNLHFGTGARCFLGEGGSPYERRGGRLVERMFKPVEGLLELLLLCKVEQLDG